MESIVSVNIEIEKDFCNFAKDVLTGLSQSPKVLPSKYFYDAKGDKLFQQIMDMPEYYLTNSEFEVLETQKSRILDLIGSESFDLIELGAGDGTKTKILIDYFLHQKTNFCYAPIDISGNVLDQLKQDLHQRWPQLCCEPVQGDYFDALENLSQSTDIKKVILFLGANIGNLQLEEAEDFLSHVGEYMQKEDIILIGFDLKKDPKVILDAYNDPKGITAAFNLNLLHRINRELQADFKVNQFKHWETYNPVTGATRSFIVSTCEQTVHIEALDTYFHFNAWEAIDVELSQKYDTTMIENLAKKSGFEVVEHLFDRKGYFVDSVWRKK